MDWQALKLSLLLGLWTVAVLIPAGILLARIIAWRRFPGRNFLQTLLALPLLLPPTVLGFYLLIFMGNRSALGRSYESVRRSPGVFVSGFATSLSYIQYPFCHSAHATGLRIDFNLYT